jgi:hypothetical protein
MVKIALRSRANLCHFAQAAPKPKCRDLEIFCYVIQIYKPKKIPVCAPKAIAGEKRLMIFLCFDRQR